MDPNNPQMMAMAQALMSDPTIMNLIQSKPELLSKLQSIMANPASAMSMMGDPDIMLLMTKLQGLMGGMGGGGMGGMGGGMGGLGGFGGGGGAASGGGDSVVHIKSAAQFDTEMKNAGDKLVAVDFTASWCGPCKRIAPVFSELSSTYKGKVVFLKVDGDENRDLVATQNIQGFPTFQFYVKGSKVDEFSGADERRLRSIVERYGEEKKTVNPYKHFPIKETESVSYKQVKFDLVLNKLKENNAKLTSGQLDEKEIGLVTDITKTLDDRVGYHSSTFSEEQYAAVDKLLTWPSEHVGPVLHIIRMMLLHPHVATTWSKRAPGSANDVVTFLTKCASSSDKSVNALLAIRALANLFSRRVLVKYIATRHDQVMDSLTVVLNKFPQDQDIISSAIAVYINYAIVFSEDSATYEAGKLVALTNLKDYLESSEVTPAILYRLLIIFGTLLYGDQSVGEIAKDLELPVILAQKVGVPAASQDAQVMAAATELATLMTNIKSSASK